MSKYDGLLVLPYTTLCRSPIGNRRRRLHGGRAAGRLGSVETGGAHRHDLDGIGALHGGDGIARVNGALERIGADHLGDVDRKSTRLNSSHVKISYAVFCLK